MSVIDSNNNGVIDYTEFIAALLDEKIYLTEEKTYEAFKMFDKDNSGKISVNSPIGKGLMGKKVGEIAEVIVPNGTLKFEIISINR